jgi:hypothetical protein
MKLKPVEWMEPLIDYFWDNRERLIASVNTDLGYPYIPFDYPDYAGLPKSVLFCLSSEHVDILQENLYDELKICKTKKAFAKRMIFCLTRDTIEVL